MIDKEITIQGIQKEIERCESSIFGKQGLIEMKRKNGEDTSQLERDIETLTRKIIDGQNKIKGYENL
ncbi:MAG TPA: hypothetical protein VK808_05530 [Bacteroidia bacterium]|nr:hypothetical protein [Bacteroidia bacterium]